jgi:hypothetical protein
MCGSLVEDYSRDHPYTLPVSFPTVLIGGAAARTSR